MRTRIVLGLMICLIISFAVSGAEIRTYRQTKDVATTEKGNVRQSGNKGDLFEYTYSIDVENKTVTRIKVRRLDQAEAKKDNTIYKITQDMKLMGSESGNGGNVIVASRHDGGEILELSHRFAFSSRISPFSQVITGVYKRVYDKDHNNKFHKHR
jgi:DNA-binding transcriptional regulator of glucitol operon